MGCDGSRSQSRYKQIFHASNDLDDSDIFMSSDSYISSLKKNSKINLKPLDEDMRALLIIDVDENNDSDSNSAEDSDSE